MRNTILSIALVVGVSLVLLWPVYGQKSPVDSIATLLDHYVPEDSVKVNYLLSLADAEKIEDPAKGLEHGLKALLLAKRLGLTLHEYRANMLMGVCHIFSDNRAKALERFYTALDISKRQKNSTQWQKYTAQTYINISGVHLMDKNPGKAKPYLLKANAILRELKSMETLADNYLALGLTSLDLDEVDSSEYYLLKALPLLTQFNKQKQLSNAYLKLGVIAADRKQWEKSLNYYNQSLEIKKRLNNNTDLAHGYSNTGEILLEMGKVNESLESFRKALSLYSEKSNTADKEYLYEYMARCFEILHQPDSAIFYLKKNKDVIKIKYSEEQTRQIQELELKYKTQDQTQENELLREQNKVVRFRNALYSSMVVAMVIFISLLSWFFLRLRKKNKLLKDLSVDLQETYKESQKFQTEKKYLTTLLAHDLRHPLALIQMGLYQLQSLGEKSAEKPLIAEMEQAADRIEEMSRRIMDVENSDDSLELSLQPIALDPAKILEASKAEFQVYAQQRNLSIQIQQNGATNSVLADPYFLQRIVNNLVSNAIKFSPEGSTITLSVENALPYVKIAVSDQGPGLDFQDQSNAFQQFQRLKPQALNGESSMGYGLFIARRYAEAMEGDITVESQPGKGATFVVSIPMPKGSGVAQFR